MIETHAEQNPDIIKPEVHLLMVMKSDVHNMYMDAVCIRETELQPVSGKYFNTVWHE